MTKMQDQPIKDVFVQHYGFTTKYGVTYEDGTFEWVYYYNGRFAKFEPIRDIDAAGKHEGLLAALRPNKGE
jgi:hypothetical protein